MFETAKKISPARAAFALASAIASAVALAPSLASAQSYMSCQQVEAACEVQVAAMQPVIAQNAANGAPGPFDSLYTVANCQSQLSTAENSSAWPALPNGQPSFPCAP